MNNLSLLNICVSVGSLKVLITGNGKLVEAFDGNSFEILYWFLELDVKLSY